MMSGSSVIDFSLLDRIPVGVFALRRDGTVAFWNECLEEWTGIVRSKIVDAPVANFFPRLSNPLYSTRLQSVFEGGPPVILSAQLHKYIVPVPNMNGEYRLQHTTITAVPTSNPAEYIALFVMEDVTDLMHRIQAYRAMRDQALDQVKERERAEKAEREQRLLAESLRETISALNSTLEMDKVLDLVLTTIGRVVPCDMVDLMMVEGDQARVVRSHKYNPRLRGNTVLNHSWNIQKTTNLRWMWQTGKPCLINDTQLREGWVNIPETEWIRSYIGTPIRFRDQTLGFLGLLGEQPDMFTSAQAKQLDVFASQVAVAIENARLYQEVQELAITDPLTGLYNRRGLFQMGEREFERALRFKRPLSSIMLDIDHFKQVNDTYGHPAGDLVIEALGARCRNNVRVVDVAGRYGGEEFVLLLSEANLSFAAQTAERLRQNIETMTVPTPHGNINITISLGVAPIDQSDTLATLINRADKAHYVAKKNGRNRVEVFN